MRVLVVDNFDSFVYTLAGYLEQIGADVTVVRNNQIEASEIRNWDAVLLSPGPGAPADAGASIAIVHEAIEHRVPLLGVCLGHQALAEALGGVVTHAEQLMHGKTSAVEHDGSSFYSGVASPFTATRYHSLAVVDGTVPDSLVVTSRTVNAAGVGVIMGLRHESAPVYGVQFHPESVLTEGGYQMLGNWLEEAGFAGAAERAASFAPLVTFAKPPAASAEVSAVS
ncbi:anthranilate synthase component II [Humidisolicoccus flavus]|uniref:anthranilate synthase component II n=1 Tax=Humidisolicoccus flavus TaxID=3111414 RepID=UPI00325321BC